MVTAEVAALAVTVDVEQVAVVATRATALQMVASVLFLTVVITLVVATADLVVVDLKTHLQLVVAEATLVEAEEVVQHLCKGSGALSSRRRTRPARV